jgi:hypothetical protein
MAPFAGFPQLEPAEFLLARLDKLGGPEAYNHNAVGWAHAMDTPYRWTKQVASHFAGSRKRTIVQWPKGIKDLAKENPQKLHELQWLWLIEAVKYNVLPLDDRFAERANPDIAGRP